MQTFTYHKIYLLISYLVLYILNCFFSATDDPCTSKPCHHGGGCKTTEDGKSFTCSCPAEYGGPTCEKGQYLSTYEPLYQYSFLNFTVVFPISFLKNLPIKCYFDIFSFNITVFLPQFLKCSFLILSLFILHLTPVNSLYIYPQLITGSVLENRQLYARESKMLIRYSR